MLNNIYFALEQLGLSAQKRVLHIQFSNPDLTAQVFLQRIDGTHAINNGVCLQLMLVYVNEYSLKAIYR
jgi:type VI secretion system secreted protein VgrG